MKNKRGDILGEESLRIIIAVFSIGFLIYLAASLYFIFVGNYEKEQAKAHLENILAKANSLEEGEVASYIVTNPKDWVLTSQGVLLCFCPDESYKDDQKCRAEGVCVDFGSSVEITYASVIGRQRALFIYETPLAVFLKKGKDTIEINYGSLSEGAQQEIFVNFLDAEYHSFDKYPMPIREQILIFASSAKLERNFLLQTVWKIDKDKKNHLQGIIKDYFKDYDYEISIVLNEVGTPHYLGPMLVAHVGKGVKEVETGEVPPYAGVNWQIEREQKDPLFISVRTR
jgi:hypothetical protein